MFGPDADGVSDDDSNVSSTVNPPPKTTRTNASANPALSARQRPSVSSEYDSDNLTLAQKIAMAQNKELKYKMVDFHSSRPGHDLRYALDGTLMKELGWEPKVSIDERISQVVNWTLNNDRWLKL